MANVTMGGFAFRANAKSNDSTLTSLHAPYNDYYDDNDDNDDTDDDDYDDNESENDNLRWVHHYRCQKQ